MNLYKAVNNACSFLPPGYHANIHMENGAWYVELFGPSGKEIPLSQFDGIDIDEQVNEAVITALSIHNRQTPDTMPGNDAGPFGNS